MEEQNEHLTGLYLLIDRHWPSLVAIPYPFLILLDAYTIPSSDAIYIGQPFLYSWYVFAGFHLGVLLLLGLIVFFFLIIRMFIVKSGPFRFVPPVLFIIGYAFCLLPFISFTSIPDSHGSADHVDSAALNQTKYNLYSEIYTGRFQKTFILVRCDSLGLVCHFVNKWEREITLLSKPTANLVVDTAGNKLAVIIDSEVVYSDSVE